jgi:dTDP-D-glucose 4,6-dehydratase
MSYNLPIVIIRANNVYGPRQYPEKVIPKFILRLLGNKPVILHGSGSQLRSFLHCNDIAAAIDIVLHKGVIGEVYNIASEVEISIVDLAKKLIGLMKPGEPVDKWLQTGPDRNFNDQRYWIKSDKLGELGWAATHTFDEELPMLVDWYKIHEAQEWWSVLPGDI